MLPAMIEPILLVLAALGTGLLAAVSTALAVHAVASRRAPSASGASTAIDLAA